MGKDHFTYCLSILIGQAFVLWILGWIVYAHAFHFWLGAGLIAAGSYLSLDTTKAYVRELVRTRRANVRWERAAILLAMAIVLFCIYLPPNFNLSDDSAAYAVFPLKISHTGGLNAEPFSERRLFSLGAHYPLQALVLSFLPLRYLSLIEPALGAALTLLFVGILSARQGKSFAHRLMTAVGLLLIVCLAGSGVLANLAPAFLLLPPLVLLTFAASDWKATGMDRSPLYGGLLGVVVALLTSLRPTATPLAAGLLLLITWFSSRRSPKQCVFVMLAAACGALLFLLPFALELHRSSGTYLYPLLGRGNHASARGEAPSITTVLSISDHLHNLWQQPLTDIFLLIAIGSFLAQLWWQRRAIPVRLTMVFAGLIATYGVIVYQTGGVSVHRYAAPLVLSFLLYLIASGYAPRIYAGTIKERSWPRYAVPAVVLFSILVGLRFYSKVQPFFAAKLAVRERALLPASDELADYRQLQAAVPPGASILSALQRNNLFDFGRNLVLVNDQPGMAAPLSGWPFGHGGQYLAHYLQEHDVQYVAIMREALEPVAFQVLPTGWAGITSRASIRFYDDLNDWKASAPVAYQSSHLVLYRVPNAMSVLSTSVADSFQSKRYLYIPGQVIGRAN